MPTYKIVGDVTKTREVVTEAQSSVEARQIFEDYFKPAETQIFDVRMIEDDEDN